MIEIYPPGRTASTYALFERNFSRAVGPQGEDRDSDADDQESQPEQEHASFFHHVTLSSPPAPPIGAGVAGVDAVVGGLFKKNCLNSLISP